MGQRRNKKDLIPKGMYCYTRLKNGKIKVCPYWKLRNNKPEQINGYCSFLKRGDWQLTKERYEKNPYWINCKTGKKTKMKKGFPLSFLWDMVKECGINEYTEEELLNDCGEIKSINVLSLFDGISCGQVALERAGIKVDKYYASEIDKYAIKVTQKNYPNTIQLGDIKNWKKWDIEKPDLIMGGSPCQGFSLAGKGLNFNDPRSKLFFDFVDILDYYKPKYFLLENVRMKKEWRDIISKYMKVEPIEINSALVSAQNRKRLYWINISNITQPQDKNIMLSDILEKDIPQKYYFNQKRIHYILSRPKSFLCKLNPKKSNTLRTNYGNASANETYIYQLSHGQNVGGIRAKFGKTPCLTHSNWEFNNLLLQYLHNVSLRKLTPIECERLQTLPDNYTESISNTQRYKCLGNGWTVDVIVHILKNFERRI